MLTTASLKLFPREVGLLGQKSIIVLCFQILVCKACTVLPLASNVWVLAYQGLVTRMLSYFWFFQPVSKERGYFIVILICISLTVSEIGCMFICLKPSHSFFLSFFKELLLFLRLLDFLGEKYIEIQIYSGASNLLRFKLQFGNRIF